MKSITLAAACILLAIGSSSALAKPSRDRAPKPVIKYTVKQFTLDGKPLGEWTTRFESPSRADSCWKWRLKEGGPFTEICGGIVQVTADDSPLLTHQ